MTKVNVNELNCGLTVYDKSFNNVLDFFPNVVKKINARTRKRVFVYTNSAGEEKILKLDEFPHIYHQYVKADEQTLDKIESESKEHLFYVDNVKIYPKKIQVKEYKIGNTEVLSVERQNSRYALWHFSRHFQERISNIGFESDDDILLVDV